MSFLQARDRSLDPTPRSFVLFGIFLLPLSLLVMPDVGEVAYTLLSLAGLACLLRNRLSSAENRKLLLPTLLTLGFFLVAAVSILVSGDYSAWFRPLKKLSELLATPFIALLVLRARVTTRFIMLMVKASALVVFSVALYQFITGVARPGGAVSPLVFGHIGLLFGFFSLVRFPVEPARARTISLLAFAAGCGASVLSQSRIVWVTSFFLLADILYVWHRAGVLSKRIALLVAGSFLTLVLFSLSMPIVQNKIAATVHNYQSFVDDGVWNTSVGQRLVMWESGLEAAVEKPLLGWGLHRTQQAAAAELSDPALKRQILEHHNLHNEYVNSLVGKGLLGLLSLCSLLFVPLVIFLKHSSMQDRLAYTGIGSLLCLGYTVSGFTFQAFGDDAMNIVYVLFLSISLPRMSTLQTRD